MSTRMPNDEAKKNASGEQEQEGQGQPLGQKRDNTVRDRKKRTVQFDEGQKFTSDEDIIRRRTA